MAVLHKRVDDYRGWLEHLCLSALWLWVPQAAYDSLVDLWQTPLHVPECDQAQTGCGAGLAMVLVLEDPVNLT